MFYRAPSPRSLKHIKTLTATGYIFKSIKGNPLTRRKFYVALKWLGKRVLNKNISPHTMRHSHINNMLEKNPHKLQAISVYAGYSSASITLNMYIHQSIEPQDIERLVVV